MKIVMKFTYNQKDYCVYQENDCLHFGYIENNLIKKDLSEDEITIVKQIYSKLIPSNILLNLGEIKYNNKSFQHYLDKKTTLSLFYEKDDNKLKAPDEKDLAFLNVLYNNQDEYLALENNKNNEFFKRLIKYGKKTIVVLITCTTLLTALPKEVLANEEINEKETQEIIDFTPFFDKETITPINDDIIKDIDQAINNNPNLTPEEKELFLSCPKLFTDNSKCFNYEVLLTKLCTLKINYCNYNNNSIKGLYHPEENYIEVFNATNYNDCQKSTLLHEFCHSISFANNNWDITIGSGIMEGLNVIINREYFKEDESYTLVTPYSEALCEILGENFMREMALNFDYKQIVLELTKIIPNEKLALQTIKDIDALKNIEELNHSDELINNLKKEVSNNLSQYYEVKNNRKIDDDLIMLYYLDKDTFHQKINSYGEIKTSSFAHFNKENKDSNLIISIPINIQETYKEMTFDEAIEAGYIVIINNIYTLSEKTDGFIDYNNKVFKLKIEYVNDWDTFVIDNNNRYNAITYTK